MKILWINPIGTDIFDNQILANLNAIKRENTIVDIISLKDGRPINLEYHSYEALVVPDIIRETYHASKKGYQVVIIGCFYDVALHEAREISGNTTVIGPCQASVAIASNLGNNFSVLVGSSKWIPKMKRNIISYGYRDFLASFRDLNLSVDDLDFNFDLSYNRLLEQGRLAIESDKAEVLILGCTAADKYYKELQKELGIPVLDPLFASFKVAEMFADLSLICDIFPSHAFGNQPPSDNDISQYLEE